jgi:hypothetical protein
VPVTDWNSGRVLGPATIENLRATRREGARRWLGRHDRRLSLDGLQPFRPLADNARHGPEERPSIGMLRVGEDLSDRPVLDHKTDGAMLSLDIGGAWDVGERSRLVLVFSEDLITQSAPDFTVTAAWILSW